MLRFPPYTLHTKRRVALIHCQFRSPGPLYGKLSCHCILFCKGGDPKNDTFSDNWPQKQCCSHSLPILRARKWWHCELHYYICLEQQPKKRNVIMQFSHSICTFCSAPRVVLRWWWYPLKSSFFVFGMLVVGGFCEMVIYHLFIFHPTTTHSHHYWSIQAGSVTLPLFQNRSIDLQVTRRDLSTEQ